MTKVMTTAELLKEKVDSGAYKPHNYMCNVIKSDLHHKEFPFWPWKWYGHRSYVQCRKTALIDIKNFLDELAVRADPKQTRRHRHDVLFCALEQYYMLKLDISCFITKDLKSLCVQIYSDWDNRFKIVDDFVPGVIDKNTGIEAFSDEVDV